MIIVHVAPIATNHVGGINSAVTSLARAQAALPSVEVALVVSLPRQEEWGVTDFPIFRRGREVCEDGDLQRLPPPFGHPHVVVLHSTFIPWHARVARRLRLRGIPYVICPQGGMTQEALAVKPLKKRLGCWLFFNRLVRHAAGLHFLTAGERRRSAGWQRPSFICGNGTFPPPHEAIAPLEPVTPRRVLFLGRLNVHVKGLDLLVAGAQLVQETLRRQQTVIDIVGPEVNRSGTVLRRMIASAGVDDLIHIHPPVTDPEAKSRLFGQSHVFVHTSRTEGHPLAVLEALSFGLPCLVTPETNMAEDIVENQAGWATSADPAQIADDLKRLAEAPIETLRYAGRAAREMVLRDLTWRAVAEKTLTEYRRILASAGCGKADIRGSQLPLRATRTAEPPSPKRRTA